jgi:hypothetical protein
MEVGQFPTKKKRIEETSLYGYGPTFEVMFKKLDKFQSYLHSTLLQISLKLIRSFPSRLISPTKLRLHQSTSSPATDLMQNRLRALSEQAMSSLCGFKKSECDEKTVRQSRRKKDGNK